MQHSPCLKCYCDKVMCITKKKKKRKRITGKLIQSPDVPELANASPLSHLIIPGVGRTERNRNHTAPLVEEETGTVILENNLAVLVKFGMSVQ